MKIRWKLLILLLTIALVPLIVVAVLDRLSTRSLGGHLASGRREILTRSARSRLQYLVDEYAEGLARDKKVLELALRMQAREVEQALASAAPPSPRLYFAEDYDKGEDLPEGMAPSEKHLRQGPDGKPAPMPVTYREQAYLVFPGVDRRAVADDMARLAAMPAAYRFLHESNPALMHWQYTALESGFHTSFPGHGGYPAGYDSRKRLWYVEARRDGALGWRRPLVDASTRTVMLTLSMPVRRPDGAFAGVTGIDLPITGIFRGLKLPERWAGEAATMLVVPAGAGSESEGKLLIVAENAPPESGRDWEIPVELPPLESDDPEQLRALAADAIAGRSGVRKMPYGGREALWAHGAGSRDQPFPVVIVPHDIVVAEAVEAERHVLDMMFRSLEVAGAILLGVIVVVVVVALRSSRAVTRPVTQLREVAERLSGGDYDTRVQIRTGDELQELGDIVNDMGPKLREREEMKRSLALATEIQQHLLPHDPPALASFDIAGASHYCDETGGDYYDFIELMELGRERLGIAVGDVTGHGIGAALLMASARGVLRSHAARHGDLGELFAALNAHLVRDTGEERFMTLFYGLLDGASRSLCWTSAGHDPPMWLRAASGRVEELATTGIPLGILDGSAYSQEGPVTLESGDVVLIGTDGIWEAANPDKALFGKDRLRELLAARAGEAAADIHAAVVQAVSDFRQTAPQADDITLVVVKAL